MPPRFEAPGELAILAARSFDMPLSLRASYCFSFFTLADFDGTARSYPAGPALFVPEGPGQLGPTHLRATGEVRALRLLVEDREAFDGILG